MKTETIIQKSRDKYYRGKKIEELKNLDTREFAKLVKSRSRRAIMRNYNVIENFVKRCDKKLKRNKLIKTHNREMVIVPAMLGKTIGIYNGKDFIKINIMEEMLGHRLGEFSLTRKQVKHGTAGIGATKSSSSRAVK